MKSLSLITATAVLLGVAIAGGCATGEDDGEAGDNALSGPEADACKIFIVKDQKFVDLNTFANDPQHPERKNDPVLQKIFKDVLAGGKCPKSYAEMQKQDSLKSCALVTRVVSERSALLKTPDVGRALASRKCGNDMSLFFLLDPVNTDPDQTKPFITNERSLAACKGKPAGTACAFKVEEKDEDDIIGSCTTTGGRTDNITVCLPPAVPSDVEVLGNDTTDGIFSYYAHEPPTGPGEKGTAIWKFYGTSVDFVSNGYDCDPKKFHGACQSKFAQDNGVPGNKSGARCASCHPGGGMVQKELNSPWSNWMIEPGNYVSKNTEILGRFENGDSFESTTTDLNTKWAKKRAEILSKKSVKDMLRPVFCTMDINLQSGGSSVSFTQKIDVRNDLMIDLAFADPQNFFGSADAFGSTGGQAIAQIDQATYNASIAAINQFIPGDFGKDESGKDKHPFSDTADAFFYPERSQLDHQYVAALKNQNLVSEDLLRDILFVDFTRPIFSPTRCSLADLADGITAGPTMKDQFIKKIQGKGGNATPAEQEFLKSLQATDAAPRHQNDVTTYLNACKARATSDAANFSNDVVNYASHLRQVAKLMKVKIKVEQEELGILDFDETVPQDSNWGGTVSDPKFDPQTCTLAK